jgi:hypothetical protein
MEGTRIEGPHPLAVLQEFAGGRLEKQVWSRAYELAVPVVRAIGGTIRIPNRTQSPIESGLSAARLSKGA